MILWTPFTILDCERMRDHPQLFKKIAERSEAKIAKQKLLF